jgi:hypothetical protein
LVVSGRCRECLYPKLGERKRDRSRRRGNGGGRGDVQGDMQISRSIYTPVRLRWRVANGVSATLQARARASYRMDLNMDQLFNSFWQVGALIARGLVSADSAWSLSPTWRSIYLGHLVTTDQWIRYML